MLGKPHERGEVTVNGIDLKAQAVTAGARSICDEAVGVTGGPLP
jgi:hypothetical protein